MTAGGRRPGAGRKRGSVVMRSRATANRLMRLETTPLDIMVRGTLELWVAAQATVDRPERLRLVREAISAAAQAAPYMHPRLTSVSHTVRTIRSLKDLTDEELVALAASAGAAAASPAMIEGDAERVQ